MDDPNAIVAVEACSIGRIPRGRHVIHARVRLADGRRWDYGPGKPRRGAPASSHPLPTSEVPVALIGTLGGPPVGPHVRVEHLAGGGAVLSLHLDPGEPARRMLLESPPGDRSLVGAVRSLFEVALLPLHVTPIVVP